MAKDWRVTGNATVPDSATEQAKLLSQIAEHKAAFEQAVSGILGQEFSLQDKVVAPGRGGPRGPRAAKLEAVTTEAA